MKAITFDTPGEPSVLKMVEVENPKLKMGQVRIEVKASGVNRADTLQRKGLYPAPAGESEILGMEVSGIIREVCPTGASNFVVGDRVMALSAGGAYAEQLCVDAGLVLRLPETISFVEGAGIMETFLTAHHNLFFLGQIDQGESALVHAGASGVGLSAIQLLRFADKKVFATVGSSEKAGVCEEYGARAILYRQQKFSPTILKETEDRGVDVILDPVGASYFESNLNVLASGGSLVLIGQMGGSRAQVNLSQLLKKRLRVIGSTLRGLPLIEKRAIVSRFWQRFGGPFKERKIMPVLDRVYPIRESFAAHERMENNLNSGKIILVWE